MIYFLVLLYLFLVSEDSSMISFPTSCPLSKDISKRFDMIVLSFYPLLWVYESFHDITSCLLLPFICLSLLSKWSESEGYFSYVDSNVVLSSILAEKIVSVQLEPTFTTCCVGYFGHRFKFDIIFMIYLLLLFDRPEGAGFAPFWLFRITGRWKCEVSSCCHPTLLLRSAGGYLFLCIL